MIYWTSMYLVLFLFSTIFYRHVATAYCCQSKSKSSSMDRTAWMSDVGTLDELHLRYLKKTILTNLRINKVPEEARRWRRTRSVAALLEQQSQSSIDNDFNDNNDNVRYYSLKVVGLQTSGISGHRKRRIHNHYRNGHKGCAAHFEFVAKLTETGNNNDYETILEKAELQLPSVYGTFILHTNQSTTTLDRRIRDVDQQTPHSNEKGSDSSSVQGRHGIVDVTAQLRSVWSSERGTNVSLTWKTRNACRRENRDDIGTKFVSSTKNIRPLILRMELNERRKRNDRSLTKRQIDSNFQRNVKKSRQDIIIDCEQQWDAAFLRNISAEVYDGLMPCCRRKVKVDFNDLGWDQWVVAPQSFDSYYCIGRCTHFGGFASEDTEGASFYTELMNLQRRARSLGLSPCCSPVKFSPLTITVLTGDNEEMTQTLEDVVVRQCGCM